MLGASELGWSWFGDPSGRVGIGVATCNRPGFAWGCKDDGVDFALGDLLCPKLDSGWVEKVMLLCVCGCCCGVFLVSKINGDRYDVVVFGRV